MLFCTQCGNEVRENYNYCKICGNTLRDEELSPKTISEPNGNHIIINDRPADHKEKKKRNFSSILGWIFGFLFILIGIGLLEESIEGGILVFLSGLIILPPFGEFLEHGGIRIPGWIKIAGLIILFIMGIGMLPGKTATSTSQITKIHSSPENDLNSILKTAESYSKASIGQDYEEAYKLLVSSAKLSDYYEWVNKKKTLKNNLLMQGLTYEFIRVENPKIDGETATVDVKYYRHIQGRTGSASLRETKSIDLIKQEGSWKIVKDVKFT